MSHLQLYCLLLLNVLFQHYTSQPIPQSNPQPNPQSNSQSNFESIRGYPVQVEIIACDGWQYASTSNSMQIQLKGQYDSTPFIFINKFTSLPTNGRSQIYHTELYYYDFYGLLFSVQINVDDIYGYCIKGLTIFLGNDFDNNNVFGNISNQLSDQSIRNTRNTRDNSNGFLNTTDTNNNNIHEFYFEHFGMGVILTKKCKYTYRSLSPHRSLIRCFDDYFEIYSRYTIMLRRRGVYKTVIHTCIHPKSGINSIDMKKNVYSVIMGKLQNINISYQYQNVYQTTEFEYLDHVQVGYIDLDKLGHIVAANVMLSYEYAFYSRNIEGTIIGIKLEAVAYTDHQIYFQDIDITHFSIKINGQPTYIHSISVLGFGRYLIAFLASKDRIFVTKSTEIIIYGNFASTLFLNVFVIFEGYNNKYKLPFVVEEYKYKKPVYEYDTTQPINEQQNLAVNNEENTDIIATNEPFETVAPDVSEISTTESTTTEETINFQEYKKWQEDVNTENGEKNPYLFPEYKPYDRNLNLNYKFPNMKRRRVQESDINDASYNLFNDKHGINWFDANKYCMEKYGTWLTSIHSVEENFLIHGFIGNSNAGWIGFVDFDINSMYTNDQHNGCYMNTHNTNYFIYNCDWKWIDGSFVDYTNWKSGGPNNLKGEDCIYMDGNGNGGWIDIDCESRTKWLNKFVCLSGKWYPDHKRKFEINQERYFNKHALITIGNENTENEMCIDSISVGIDKQVFITVNWIGGEYPDTTLNVIFRAPVCKTEVIQMKPLYDTQIFQLLVPGQIMPNQICQNEGRMGQSMVACIVDQNYALGKRTVFRISENNEQLENVLWSSVSKVTLNKKQIESFETTNVLEMDQLYRIRYTELLPNGTRIFLPIRSLNLIPILVWNDVERNIDEMEDNIPINFNLQQWERISLGNLQCSAETYIPAGHSTKYDMQFNAIIMQINLLVDLKLTLCPQFVNSIQYNQDTRFIYAADVIAQVLHQEPTACYVRWYASEYIPNTKTCADEQKLSILTQNPGYLPRCRINNPKLYDGCQCNLYSFMCWCVDHQGNLLDGQAVNIADNMTWQDACINHLKCNNSDVTLTSAR